MSTPAVEIPIRADTSQAKRAISELSSEIVGRLTPVVDVGELATKAFGALTSAVSSAVGWLRDAAAAAADAEKTQRLLAAAVGDHYDALSAFNGALSAKLGMDDDDLAAMQTKLVGLGVQQSKLEEATKATLGLAAATGKDLMAATKQVSAAFVEGGAEAKRLASLYVFAEEEVATFEGRTRALNTAWGDLTETLGGSITKSEGVTEQITGLTAAIQQLNKELDTSSAIDSFVDRIATGWNRATSAIARGIADTVARAGDLINVLGNAVGIAGAGDDLPGMSSARVLRAYADAADPSFTTEPIAGPKPKPPKAKTKAAAARSVGASPAMSPEQAQGDLGRFSEFDAETDRQARAALDADKQLADTLAAQREAERAAVEAASQRAYDAEEKQAQAHYAQLTSIGLQGVVGFLGSTVNAWASGRASLEEAAGMAFGGVLSQLGNAMVAIGTASIAAGVLGSVSPLAAIVTGGPATIAAGAGLVAAGVALAGAGAYISATSAPTGGASSAARASAPRLGEAGPMGYRGDQGNGPQTTVINVNFGAGLVTGTPREIGRTIADMLRQADSLRPGWQR